MKKNDREGLFYFLFVQNFCEFYPIAVAMYVVLDWYFNAG